jgi:hypothetical protein
MEVGKAPVMSTKYIEALNPGALCKWLEFSTSEKNAKELLAMLKVRGIWRGPICPHVFGTFIVVLHLECFVCWFASCGCGPYRA